LRNEIENEINCDNKDLTQSELINGELLICI
jgi:hypothetical protein